MKLLSILKGTVFLTSTIFLSGAFASGVATTTTTLQVQAVPRSDDAVTTDVKSKIAQDMTVAKKTVDVVTTKGIVYLSGAVDSNTEAATLVQISQSIAGVDDVNVDKLTVKDSQQPLADTAITAKVKGLFARERLMGSDIAAMAIKVETNNGVVYLSGTIDNKEQSDKAVGLAQSVKGVKQVESRLEVKTAS